MFAMYGGIKDFDKFEKGVINNLNSLLLFLEDSLNYLENVKDKDSFILSEIKKYQMEMPKLSGSAER